MAVHLFSCTGYRKTTTSHCTPILNISSRKQNTYIGKKFFTGENFRSIIECLDGGYHIAMDLIKSMTQCRSLRQGDAARLTSYSHSYDTRLKHQSSLSSYHTTREVQLRPVETFDKQVKIINKCCNNIQQVINQSQQQIDTMYPHIRFRHSRKHYRTHEMEEKFKRARSPLCKVLQTLKGLRKQRRKTLSSRDDIDAKIENLNLDSTTNEDKKLSLMNKKRKKENKLEDIEENIIHAEEKRKKKEKEYIAEARDIFKECQQLEQQRLDQIRRTLTDFYRAVHSSKYSTELNTIYETLVSDIKTQQNSSADLDYWAQTYGVTDLTITESTEKNDNDDDDDDDDSAIYDVDDEDEDDGEDEDEDEDGNEDQESAAITTTQAIPV